MEPTLSDQAQQDLFVGSLVALVVIVALVFGRRLLVKWKGGTIDTGRDGGSMDMTAKGRGSRIENASQFSAGAGSDQMRIQAKGGGQVKDAHQERGEKGEGA